MAAEKAGEAAQGHVTTDLVAPAPVYTKRRRGVARHKGESFADMALRLSGNVRARGRQWI